MLIASLLKSVRSLWVKSGRRTRRPSRAVDELETRILLTVSAYEQLFLELANRARANPTAEAARFGIDLNEGLAAGTIVTGARQPLAFNDSLQTAIQGHLQDMIDRDFFSHTGSNGSTFTARITAAGYTSWTAAGENIAYRATSASPNVEAMVIQEHQDLFVDAGIVGRGHRKNILENRFKETGAGVRTGVYKGLNAVFTGNDFGAKAGNSFLTGVVITDSVSANNFYNVGEGLAGISIVVKNGATAVATTTSNAAGGYQIQVPAGTYTVTFSGAGISSPITKTFTIAALNVKVDANTKTDVAAAPTVSFATSTYSANEGDATKLVTVSLSRAAATAVSVRYATSNGTALSGSDYTATTGTLTFAIGETSKTFSIPITNDVALELTETVNLTLSAPVGVTLGTQPTAVLSIVDNEVRSLNFERTSLSGAESLATASFNVLLSGASSQSVTVNFAVRGGTATSGSDFTLTAGTLTFAPGQTSKAITFGVINDLLDENDETVEIALSAPTNAILGASPATVYTIVDNDVAPNAKIDLRSSTGAAITALTIAESGGFIDVPVILSGVAGRAITVTLAAALGGTAVAGSDFALPTASVTFAPGETRKVIRLTINDDLLDEANETIKLALTSATATIGVGSTATVTIIDNDVAPTVSFTTATSSGLENVASPGTVRVKLSAASGQSVTVKYAFTAAGSTASSLYDFTLAAGTLTFLPGETEKTIPLVLKNDTRRESIETIKITLSAPVNATLGSLLTHLFSILDND